MEEVDDVVVEDYGDEQIALDGVFVNRSILEVNSNMTAKHS